ncbi:hypothetical protein GCM10025867_50190 (plasmid) [Frondihabitans sucicola]|uniref:DUF304 domain-containing protein n=1 Tax=Frondihabitans sucicola TaxID=1268041 RepID=A0ABM8GWD9_9MICO|nr:hypothetical protein [Frondihabitans sucicola]BDZ52778.1 hypothetical protein GCM10025867_50190 [Frondihabitans sucicola]
MDKSIPTYGILRNDTIDGVLNSRTYDLAMWVTTSQWTIRSWIIPALISLGSLLAIIARASSIFSHEDTVRPADIALPVIAVAVWFYPALRRHNYRQAVRIHVANALLNIGVISDAERPVIRKQAAVHAGMTSDIAEVDQVLVRKGVPVTVVVRLLGGTTMQYIEVDPVAQKRDIAQYGAPGAREA